MFSRNRDEHHESGTVGGMIRPFTASSLCFLQRNLVSERRGINISGVDFWHAVEFSRNGRFLCTHPLGLSSGLPFGVSNLTRSVFRSVPGRNSFPVAVGGPLPFRLPSGSLSASPTLSEVLGRSDRPFISQ